MFVPLLVQQAGGDKHAAIMSSRDDRGQSGMLNEFLADLNKFVGQVGQTLHELQGIRLSSVLCLLLLVQIADCPATKLDVHAATCLL